MERVETVRVAPHHFSRLLYANPVCLLTVVSDDGQQCGLMVLSWLTAINNYGLFFASINAGRYTAAVLMAKGTKSFVLSVPVHGMEGLLGRLGKCSSSDTNKFVQFDLPCCRPGWRPLCQELQRLVCRPNSPTTAAGEEGGTPDAAVCEGGAELVPEAESTTPVLADAKNPDNRIEGKRSKRSKTRGGVEEDECPPGTIAIASCAAHLVCTVDRLFDDSDGHLQLRCCVSHAWVRRDYWTGHTFRPTAPHLPPYLTFFGGGEFGIAHPVALGPWPPGRARGAEAAEATPQT